MNEKYKNAYNDLELAEKRNEFNNEMKERTAIRGALFGYVRIRPKN